MLQKEADAIERLSPKKAFCGNELAYDEPERNEKNSLPLSYAEAMAMAN